MMAVRQRIFLLLSALYMVVCMRMMQESGRKLVGSSFNSARGKLVGPRHCIGTQFVPIRPPDITGDSYWQTTARDPNIAYIERGKYSTKPKLITFDAYNTMIYPSQSVGKWYRQALNIAGDMCLRLPRPALFSASFKKQYKEMDAKHPCFGAKTGLTSEQWWAQLIEKTYRNTEFLDAVQEDEWPVILPKAFEILYKDIFSTSEGWTRDEDIVYTLQRLVAWRDQGGGPRLGVISNFDSRLPTILKEMKLDKYFDFILTSHECKSEKPNPEIFQTALDRAGVKNPAEAFHVGDTLETDVYGATSAGWNAMHYNKNFDEVFPDWSEINTVATAADGHNLARARMLLGRKDLTTGAEWTELWGLDDVLHMFGFPDDQTKMVRTSRIRGAYEDDAI